MVEIIGIVGIIITILGVGFAGGSAHLDARLSALDTRLHELDTRLHGLATAVGDLRERIARLEGAMEGFMAGFRRGWQGADSRGTD